MTHNTFQNLSASWLSLNGNAQINIVANTFIYPLEEVIFNEGEHFCSFQDNSIHKISDKTLSNIYQMCLIGNASFELPCDCEMKSIPTSYKDQSKCIVSAVEHSMCFNEKYISIEKYQKTSCKDNTYMAWSECGTKINIMIIGVSVGLGIVVTNIVICFICKRRMIRVREERQEARNNNYRMRTPTNDSDAERKSGEIIIDGLVPQLNTIKVTTKVTKSMHLKDLPIPFTNRMKMGCVPTQSCFPKHLESSDNPDGYYYSNDNDFKVI